MNVLDVLKGIWEASGFAALTWKQAFMIGVSFLFIYLAIGKKFEPLLLLPIAFGMLLANLPGGSDDRAARGSRSGALV